ETYTVIETLHCLCNSNTVILRDVVRIEIFEAISLTAQLQLRMPVRNRRIVDHDHVVGRAANGDRALGKFVSDFALGFGRENQLGHDVDVKLPTNFLSCRAICQSASDRDISYYFSSVALGNI